MKMLMDKPKFDALGVSAGDLLVFRGELDQLSLPNHSDQPRHTVVASRGRIGCGGYMVARALVAIPKGQALLWL
jgi:hypothetical protein